MIKKFVYLATVCLMASCSGADLPDLNESPQTPGIKTKFESHKVSLNHIEKLLRSDSVMTRGEENITRNIEGLTLDKSDTLFYVYQKPEGGWTLYASDTRVPAIVAESSNGSFEDLMKVEPAKMWIEGMMEDMAAVREASDEMLNFTPEQIEANQSFWKALTAPDDFAKDIIIENPRTYGLDGILNPKLWPGHYELVKTTTYTEVYDSIPRFTETNWTQRKPYNNYCPIKTSGTERSPAGCIAISAAQVLYYMHFKVGVPKEAPTYAYCNSRNNEKPYDWDQKNPTSFVWSMMNNDGERAAPLIAEIGKRVNMHYTDSSSSAPNISLTNVLKTNYNMPCTLLEYEKEENINKLRISLTNKVPVILSSSGYSDEGKKLNHSFYADSYKRYREVTEYEYVWIYDTPPPDDLIVPQYPKKLEYVYSSPEIDMIGINWGWGPTYNQPYFNGWYSLTGDWLTYKGKWNFYFNRYMIYFPLNVLLSNAGQYEN